jgi:hypothetical protein
MPALSLKNIRKEIERKRKKEMEGERESKRRLKRDFFHYAVSAKLPKCPHLFQKTNLRH